MKKKLFYYLFAVLCTATLFTSCSDDDDEVKYPIDTELAGGYVGNLSVNVDGNQMGTTENQKITISQSNKETNQIAISPTFTKKVKFFNDNAIWLVSLLDCESYRWWLCF